MSVAMLAYNKRIAVDLEAKVARAWAPRLYPLNPQQTTVAEWTENSDGSCIIHAKAGTGKSSTLVGLLRYIASNSKAVTVATTHSAGFSAWRKHIGHYVKPDPDKMRKVFGDLSVKTGNSAFLSQWVFLRKIVDSAKMAGFGCDTCPAIDDLEAWEYLVEMYGLATDIKDDEPVGDLIQLAVMAYTESIKVGRESIDFSDMLLLPMYHHTDFAKHGLTYDWVLGDEVQDWSHIRQMLALAMVKPKTGRLVGAGDEYQFCYGFTGVTCGAMDLLTEKLQAVSFPLNVTYRCPKSVVRVAQRWVPDIEAHESAPEGQVWGFDTGRPPVYLIPDVGSSQVGFWSMAPFTYEDAILCRNNKPLVELAYAFLRRGIPAMIEGKEVGHGMIKLAQRWKVTRLEDLESRLEDFRLKEVARLTVKHWESKVEDVHDRVDTMYVLIQATREQGGSTVAELVSLIGRMFGDTPDGQRPRCITLSSVHKAKGLEWKRVFVLGFQKYMPSKWAKQPQDMQQEENLMYIAVTRAMDTLVEIVVSDKK